MAKVNTKNELINKAPVWQWDEKHYLMGTELINEVDIAARKVEKKWGIGRLRILIDNELRDKFDRQQVKFKMAMANGDLANLKVQATRMRNAYAAADNAAHQSGCDPAPEAWEAVMSDGTLLKVVRSDLEAWSVNASETPMEVWTMQEVVRLIETQVDEVRALKRRFKGAVLESLRVAKTDPLSGPRKPFVDDDIDSIKW